MPTGLKTDTRWRRSRSISIGDRDLGSPRRDWCIRFLRQDGVRDVLESAFSETILWTTWSSASHCSRFWQSWRLICALDTWMTLVGSKDVVAADVHLITHESYKSLAMLQNRCKCQIASHNIQLSKDGNGNCKIIYIATDRLIRGAR